MSSVSCHIFSKLFQLRTGHGALGKYFRTRDIDERDHNCECGQLETVEHVLKACPLHPAERDLLRKVSPELDPKILLDTKKGLGAVVKFLDSLSQLFCWWLAWSSSLLRFYWVPISSIDLLGVMSSDIRWRRILHENLHVLRVSRTSKEVVLTAPSALFRIE